MSNEALTRSDDLATRYSTVQKSQEFKDLRSRFRRFVFTMTALFMAWYFLYVLLSCFAVDFMSTPVFGLVNWGLIIGLGQFVSTFAITIAYVRWANRNLDPAAATLREHMEADHVVSDDSTEGDVK